MLNTIQRPRTIYIRPTPPPAILCAWVKNPFYLFAHDPKHLRAEIISVNGQTVTVKEYDSVNVFEVTRANVHMVHTVNALTGETMQVYGEPHPC